MTYFLWLSCSFLTLCCCCLFVFEREFFYVVYLDQLPWRQIEHCVLESSPFYFYCIFLKSHSVSIRLLFSQSIYFPSPFLSVLSLFIFFFLFVSFFFLWQNHLVLSKPYISCVENYSEEKITAGVCILSFFNEHDALQSTRCA